MFRVNVQIVNGMNGLASLFPPSTLKKDALNLRVSEHSDLFVGKGALHAIIVVAETVIAVVVVLFLNFIVSGLIKTVVGCRRIGKMFRVEVAKVILDTISSDDLFMKRNYLPP